MENFDSEYDRFYRLAAEDMEAVLREIVTSREPWYGIAHIVEGDDQDFN
ncbi:MAG: hypothetical protein JW779_02820 [Candidatus Thorarchaeota archaeon]|nr:hypothetical protein [Candidatus Thorarchaeota archaeon]